MCSLGDERLPERFWSNVSVNEETGCWEWRSPVRSDGYGVFGLKVNGVQRTRRAHRIAYEALVGPIPDGLDLDHLCRVRNCCNPSHLEPVTRKENLRRGLVAETQRKRHAAVTHCPRGHEYTAENTRIYVAQGHPSRACRSCDRERARTPERSAYMRDYSKRRRAQAAAQAREAA